MLIALFYENGVRDLIMEHKDHQITKQFIRDHLEELKKIIFENSWSDNDKKFKELIESYNEKSNEPSNLGMVNF